MPSGVRAARKGRDTASSFEDPAAHHQPQSLRRETTTAYRVSRSRCQAFRLGVRGPGWDFSAWTRDRPAAGLAVHGLSRHWRGTGAVVHHNEDAACRHQPACPQGPMKIVARPRALRCRTTRRSAASACASLPRTPRSRTRRCGKVARVRLTNGIEVTTYAPGRGAQSAGALARAHPWRPREGPAGRPVPRGPRHARRGRRAGARAGRSKYGAKHEGVTGSCQQPVARGQRNRGPLTTERRPSPARVAGCTTRPSDCQAGSHAESDLQQRPADEVHRHRHEARQAEHQAEQFLYDLNIVKEKTGDDPLKVFKKAIDNVKPGLEVKSRRVGGSTTRCQSRLGTRTAGSR